MAASKIPQIRHTRDRVVAFIYGLRFLSLKLVMLPVLALILIVVVSFAAGYATRAVISRKRRDNYLKWKPYVRRPVQPPAFLVRGAKDKPAAPAPQDNSRGPAQAVVNS